MVSVRTPNEARMFAFTQDGGSPEDLSILHQEILVVTSGPDMGQPLTDLINFLVGLKPPSETHHFPLNDASARTHVIATLNEHNYVASFRYIEAYVNEV